MRSLGRTARGLLAAWALTLAGCGAIGDHLLDIDLGGPGGDVDDGGGVPSATRTLLSAAALDGLAFSDGTAAATGVTPLTGDMDGAGAGVHARQFFSFDVGPLGTSVASARLDLHQAAVQGAPFATLGQVILEAVDYGDTLDGADFSRPALGAPRAVSADPALGTRPIDVTDLLNAALAQGRTRFQVRLRFAPVESDGDGRTDAVLFGDAEQTVLGAQAPRLVVQE